MPRATLDYLQKPGGRPFPLLSARERARLAAADADPARHALAQDDLRRELFAADRHTVTFEFREGILRDRLKLETAVSRAVRDLDDATPEDRYAFALVEALDLLEPRVVSGWDGPATQELLLAVAPECLEAIRPAMTEDEVCFLACSPAISAPSA